MSGGGGVGARLLVHWLRLAHLARRQPQKQQQNGRASDCLLLLARCFALPVGLPPLSLSPPPFSLSHCCCGLCRRRNDGGCFLAPAARSGRRLEWIARGGSSSSRQRATSAFPHSSSAERPADGDIRDHYLTEPPVRCQPASTNPNTRSRTPRTVDLLAGLHRSARLFFPLFSYFTQ